METRRSCICWLFTVALALGLSSVMAAGADKIKTSDQQLPLDQTLYSGWRSSQVLGDRVFSKNGEYLGTVRNIVVADDGKIIALISEEAGIGITPEFVFRLSWNDVVKPPHGGVVIADLADVKSKQFGLFPLPLNGSEDKKSQGEEFLLSKVLGDYARLQTGAGYGLVKDVVFSQQGRLLAVLVARDASRGGGTLAFSYPGRTGRWSPSAGYYGLPYVTGDEADQAGLRVDLKKFEKSTDG